MLRRIPSKTRPKHHVAYFLAPRSSRRLGTARAPAQSRLWLPPAATSRLAKTRWRQSDGKRQRNWACLAVFAHPGGRPLFVTVTETTGAADSRHIDVSLWYLPPVIVALPTGEACRQPTSTYERGLSPVCSYRLVLPIAAPATFPLNGRLPDRLQQYRKGQSAGARQKRRTRSHSSAVACSSYSCTRLGSANRWPSPG